MSVAYRNNMKAFQMAKIRRLIRTQGQQFTFNRPDKNEFGEPTGQTVSVIIDGVFHETSSYVSKSATESTTIRQKSSPMILCLAAEGKKIKLNDSLNFNGKTYTVSEVKDSAEMDVAVDISLEEVQKNVSRV